MSKVFKYELGRLIFNKFFLCLLIITGYSTYTVLEGDIILGIANTAPFSGWSYSWFLSQALPLLSITLLFFVSFLYTRNEKKVQVLIKATPMSSARYFLIRCLAMVTGFILLCGIVIVISLVFFASVFQFTAFSDFLLPIALTLLPSMLFILGLGMVSGRMHIAVLYGLMLLLMLIGQIPGLNKLDLFGAAFYQSFPLTLPDGPLGEPLFFIPLSYVLERGLYALAGLLLVFCGLMPLGSRRNV